MIKDAFFIYIMAPFRFSLIILISILLCGCATTTAITHYFKSTDHFHVLENDVRILYEPGAEKFAGIVAQHLPVAIESIQRQQFSAFTKEIKIYVCATPETFQKITGRKTYAMTYRASIFLNARLMEKPEMIPQYLAHELSHLLLLQHIGLYRAMILPPWFNEGLAVYVSNGGGAADVSEKEAALAILSGKAFVPQMTGGIVGFFFRQYGNHWNLDEHMFYRQSAMFVEFMSNYDREAFKDLLIAVQNGDDFENSVQSNFNMSVEELWSIFIAYLKSGYAVHA